MAVVALGILTQAALSLALATAAAAVASMTFAAALGTFALGFSSEVSMLFPVYVVICAVSMALVDHRSVALTITLFGAAMALTLGSPLVWRRRCAA